MHNCEQGVAAVQQSQDLVSRIFFMASVFRVHLWFDWVPSKQNPGNPYSRPQTGATETVLADESMSAQRFSPQWPSFIRAGRVPWRTVLQSPHSPSTRFVSKQVEMLIGLQSSFSPSSMQSIHNIDPGRLFFSMAHETPPYVNVCSRANLFIQPDGGGRG